MMALIGRPICELSLVSYPTVAVVDLDLSWRTPKLINSAASSIF